MPEFLRATGTFARMEVHVGKILRELYFSTGLKMEHFQKGISFSDKTIYYHFGKEDLNTSILRKYDAGLKKLGFDTNVWEYIARKSKEPEVEEAGAVSMVAEPLPRIGADDSVADLLRRAAVLLDEQNKKNEEG